MEISYLKKDVSNYTLKVHSIGTLIGLRDALLSRMKELLNSHAELLSNPEKYLIDNDLQYRDEETGLPDGEYDKTLIKDLKEQMLDEATVWSVQIDLIDRHFEDKKIPHSKKPKPDIPE